MTTLSVDFWKDAYIRLSEQLKISKDVVSDLQLCLKVSEETMKIYERTNRAQAEELIILRWIVGN